MDIAEAFSLLGFRGRVFVTKVRRVQGVSEKNGRPYDFTAVEVFHGRGQVEMNTERGVAAPPEGVVIDCDILFSGAKPVLLDWRVAGERGLEAV